MTASQNIIEPLPPPPSSPHLSLNLSPVWVFFFRVLICLYLPINVVRASLQKAIFSLQILQTALLSTDLCWLCAAYKFEVLYGLWILTDLLLHVESLITSLKLVGGFPFLLFVCFFFFNGNLCLFFFLKLVNWWWKSQSCYCISKRQNKLDKLSSICVINSSSNWPSWSCTNELGNMTKKYHDTRGHFYTMQCGLRYII